MAGNTLLTRAEITYRMAAVLMNNLVFAGSIDRQYSNEFAQSGAKIGNQIHVRKPPRFTVGDGPVVVPQDITETYVTLTLGYHKNLACNYTSEDLTLSIDDFENRIIRPAAVQVANEIDRVVLQDVYSQIYNTKGTPGTRPNDSQIFLDGKARMLNQATPMDMPWQALLAPNSEASMVKALQGLFNPTAIIGEQYRRGRMQEALGFDWDVDQNMPVHTVGVLGGTPLVNGASQTGSNLITDGWTATTGAVKKGDVFTIGSGATGVYEVNPLSRRSTGDLQQFVVTADTTADGSGNMTIPISPAITPPDSLGNVTQFQTVTTSPANDAAITILGAASTATPQNLCFHPKFATLGFADLVMPYSDNAYRLVAPELGMSMRVWQDSDWRTDTHGTRIDVLFGVAVIYPSWACRVAA